MPNEDMLIAIDRLERLALGDCDCGCTSAAIRELASIARGERDHLVELEGDTDA